MGRNARLSASAFGAIPEVGSVFKGAFKPLYKQRKAAKGAVHGGLHALEVMLGMKKGGALTWIRKELIGKWGPRTRDAIATANAALAATIELTELLASASGWKDYLVPDPIQALAKQLLSGLKALRGSLDAPIQRASNEIREFLEDLLGEQAAAVVMAVGQTAAAGSAVPGSRTRAGHNAAAVHGPNHPAPTKPKPTRHGEENVSAKPKVDAKPGSGPVHGAVLNTATTLIDITNSVLGVSGEHIADYICAEKFGWGKNWKGHDKGIAGSWSIKPSKVQPGKLSRGGKPKTPHVLYKLNDGSNGTGLDAVWRAEGNNQGKPYAVVEAKASRDEDAKKFNRIQRTGRKPSIASKLGVSGAIDASDLLEPLEDDGSTSSNSASGQSSRKSSIAGGARRPKGAPASNSNTPPPITSERGQRRATELIVQMSHEWIDKNIASAVERPISNDFILKKHAIYSRHLFFSPLYHPCSERHAAAHLSGEADSAHTQHDAIHYDDLEVKKAVNKRKATLRNKHGHLRSLTSES